ADQHGQPPPKLARDAVHFGADIVEAGDVVARGGADAGRRAVFAERLAQRPAPFASGDAGLGAFDRGRHDVAGAAGCIPGILERGRAGTRVARGAPRGEPLDLLALSLLGHGDDRLGAARKRRWFAFQVLVDADHPLLTTLDRLEPCGVGLDQLALHSAA